MCVCVCVLERERERRTAPSTHHKKRGCAGALAGPSLYALFRKLTLPNCRPRFWSAAGDISEVFSLCAGVRQHVCGQKRLFVTATIGRSPRVLGVMSAAWPQLSEDELQVMFEIACPRLCSAAPQGRQGAGSLAFWYILVHVWQASPIT